jgi:hypothetical protein
MGRFASTVGMSLAIIGTAVMVYFAYGRWTDATAISSADSTPDENKPILDAYELTINPFQMKDHFVVLDTGHAYLPAEVSEDIDRPGAGRADITFEHMLDDQLAIYSASPRFGDDENEIAVELPGNDPPDTSKAWMVQVEGTRDATNGFGAKIPIATVRFIRYARFPAPPPAPVMVPAPAPLPPSPAPVETWIPLAANPVPHEISLPAFSIPLTQSTMPDGKIVLSNPSGRCATVSTSVKSNSPFVDITFEDGTEGTFSTAELEKATASVNQHCREKQPPAPIERREPPQD